MMDYENYNEFENYEDEDDNVTVWDGVKTFLSGSPTVMFHCFP